MIVTKLTRAYAKALLDLAEEQKQIGRVYADLKTINAALKDSRELAVFVKSPVVKTLQKRKILREVFESAVSQLTLEFVDLLVNHGRENKMVDIFFAFTELYNEKFDIQKAFVTTAYALSESEQAKITARLAEALRKNIELRLEVKPEVLGGINIRFGDQQYDGTLASRLREMKQNFQTNQYVAEI